MTLATENEELDFVVVVFITIKSAYCNGPHTETCSDDRMLLTVCLITKILTLKSDVIFLVEKQK